LVVIAPYELDAAIAALRAGDVIGLPTETVYGLAGDASNPDAVARIYAIKGRPATHPVIVHLADGGQVSRWAREVPASAEALAAAFWPGPLTLVLPRHASVLDTITGGQDTVALRVPAHPIAAAVLRAFDGGLAAPSANRYGRVSPTTAAHVREDLGAAVAIVLDGGPCDVGLESTIVACLDGRVTLLRPGRITVPALEAAVGPLAESQADAPRVPGSIVSHYAPRTPVEIVPVQAVVAALSAHVDAGRRVAVLAPDRVSDARALTWMDAAAEPEAYGQSLYANLRTLDRSGADVLLVADPPTGPAWAAVRDRLTRAAAH